MVSLIAGVFALVSPPPRVQKNILEPRSMMSSGTIAALWNISMIAFSSNEAVDLLLLLPHLQVFLGLGQAIY